MKLNDVNRFIALRAALLSEKAALEARLTQITKALSNQPAAVAQVAAPAPAKRGRRPRNKMSLKVAVRKVTGSKALTKPEILAAIDKLGYRFKAKNPTASLNNLLYTKGLFRNAGGKFSPAK